MIDVRLGGISMRCEIPARRVGHMSFRRAGLPVRSGLFVATTGHLNVVRHLILAGAILMPAALPARAASPPDCSGKPERGV